MREIKFRGKLLSGIVRSWVFGSLVHYSRRYGSGTRIHVMAESEEDDDIELDVDYKTIGQFTGLKGKNGVEIYEGDIIKHHNNLPITKQEYWFPIYRVLWEGLGFNITRIGGGKDPQSGIFHLRHYSLEMEVIGNIHDNPELLQ